MSSAGFTEQEKRNVYNEKLKLQTHEGSKIK